jgi:hypothetical protein
MTINKVTKLRSATAGSILTEEEIQAHFDLMNTDGWYLVGVDNLVGWYRFFWAKVT